MIKRFKSLTGGEATIKSGRDAMSDEQITAVDGFEGQLKQKDAEIYALKEQVKVWQDQYQGLLNTAKSIEQERNGLIVGLKVFTETVVNTVKSLSV